MTKTIGDMDTGLTFRETGAILYAVELALAKEEARLAYFGSDGPEKAFGSELRLRLLQAKDILNKRRELADEMGG